MEWLSSLLLGSLIAFSSALNGQPRELQQHPRARFADLKFTTDLYSHLRRDKAGEDLFFSPFSIASAFAMVAAGARGRTYQQLQAALGLTDNMEDNNRAYNALQSIINGDNGNVTLDMANKLYCDSRGFDVADVFNATLIASYGSLIEKVDFGDSERARGMINGWVEEKTRGKIQDVIPRGALSELTKMVIANAIYFKGDWAQEFNSAATSRGKFHVSEVQNKEVDMMRITDDIAVAEFDDAYVLDLPYKGYKVVMTLIVPKGLFGLADIERRLQGPLLQDYLYGARRRMRKVQLVMPKFRIDSSFGLKKFLFEMGVNDLFIPGIADLTAISTRNVSLFVDEGYHKAFVEVNEKGTEAAAATVITLIPLSAVLDFNEPLFIRVDHPSLIAIQHKHIAEPLFFGRLSSPGNAAPSAQPQKPVNRPGNPGGQGQVGEPGGGYVPSEGGLTPLSPEKTTSGNSQGNQQAVRPQQVNSHQQKETFENPQGNRRVNQGSSSPPSSSSLKDNIIPNNQPSPPSNPNRNKNEFDNGDPDVQELIQGTSSPGIVEENVGLVVGAPPPSFLGSRSQVPAPRPPFNFPIQQGQQQLGPGVNGFISAPRSRQTAFQQPWNPQN